MLGSALDANGNTLSECLRQILLLGLREPAHAGRLTRHQRRDDDVRESTSPPGRRIQKSGPLGTTNYLYLMEPTLSKRRTMAEMCFARYAQGGWLDEPLSQSRAGTTSFYELDGNLSITSLTASSGAVANTYNSYDSFGRQTATSGTIVDLFRYSGRELRL